MVLGTTLCLCLISYSAGVSLPPASSNPGFGRFTRFPRFTLWAWERPDDLRSIDPKRFAVAYLADTVRIGAGVEVLPRRQPLLAPTEAIRIAVVRIEAPVGQSRLEDPALPEQIAAIIAASQPSRGAAAVQVDFDARASQREFYRRLLTALRKRVPDAIPISITALASWCAFDDWLAGLPVDEAVPMFYRMGPERTRVRETTWNYPVHEALCAGRAGLSTDEVWPQLKPGERLYIFHPGTWSRESLHDLEQVLNRE